MKRAKVVWHNGKFVKLELANVPILSHALHYGSGVFEGIRAYETARGPAVFRLGEHIDRLFRSASVFDMRIPYSKKALANAVLAIISKNGFKECYVRPIIFYGEGQMALMPRGAKLHVTVAGWPWGAYLGEHTVLSLGVSRYVRFHPRSIVPGAKISGYYATSVLATIEARKRGFSEALLLDHEGFVAEGPGENIFMVKKGKLYTPKSPSILPGITRASVITLARDLGLVAIEKKISLKELFAADEVFLTGTAAEVAPVGKINGRRIGSGKGGPVTAKIRAAYLDAVHGRSPRYQKWLTML
jgi:branched-chain amino acid aminotransferase